MSKRKVGYHTKVYELRFTKVWSRREFYPILLKVQWTNRTCTMSPKQSLMFHKPTLYQASNCTWIKLAIKHSVTLYIPFCNPYFCIPPKSFLQVSFLVDNVCIGQSNLLSSLTNSVHEFRLALVSIAFLMYNSCKDFQLLLH